MRTEWGEAIDEIDPLILTNEVTEWTVSEWKQVNPLIPLQFISQFIRLNELNAEIEWSAIWLPNEFNAPSIQFNAWIDWVQLNEWMACYSRLQLNSFTHFTRWSEMKWNSMNRKWSKWVHSIINFINSFNWIECKLIDFMNIL